MTSFELWLNNKRGEDGTVYVISMCSFTCMHCACESGVPRAVVAHFHSKRTFCTKQDPSPSATPQSLEALVCACSRVTAYLRKAHLTKWNDLNLYGCLQGIPASDMKTKDPMHEMSCGSRYINIYTL